MDTQNPAWLSPPYYVAPPGVYVMAPQTGNYPSGPQPTAETMMQALASQHLGWVVGFLFGGAGSGNRTSKEFIDDVIAYAISLTQSQYSAVTCVGFDPTSRALYYVNLIFDTLKRIPAGNWLPNDTRSVYEAWTAPKVSA